MGLKVLQSGSEASRFKVCTEVLENTLLSWKAKGLYAAICSFEGDVTLTMLRRICRDGRDSIVAGIDELARAGIVEISGKGSDPEIDAMNIIKDMGLEFYREYKFAGCKDKRPLLFDFYIPSRNTVVEIDGPGHFYTVHAPVSEIRRRDKIKDKFCADSGIRMVRIPWWRFGEMHQALNEALQ